MWRRPRRPPLSSAPTMKSAVAALLVVLVGVAAVSAQGEAGVCACRGRPRRRAPYCARAGALLQRATPAPPRRCRSRSGFSGAVGRRCLGWRARNRPPAAAGEGLRRPPLAPTFPPSSSAAPVPCPLIYRPVCGVDSKTYANACTAAAASVVVGAVGACPGDEEVAALPPRPAVAAPRPPMVAVDPAPPVAPVPPRPLNSNAQPLAEAPARAPKPVPCPRIYAPVCATDEAGARATFANSCLAKAAAATAVADGPCAGDEAPVVAPEAPPPRVAAPERLPVIEEP